MMIHKIGTTARVWTSFFLNRIHLAIFCFLQERRNKTFLYCVKKKKKRRRKLVPSPSSSCSAIWSPEESSTFQREVTVRTVFARPRSGSMLQLIACHFHKVLQAPSITTQSPTAPCQEPQQYRLQRLCLVSAFICSLQSQRWCVLVFPQRYEGLTHGWKVL